MRFTGVTDSAYALSIDDLLRMTVERRGSDLHLAVGMPPCIRIHGDLVPVDAPVLKAQDVEHMILSIIQDYQKEKLEQEMELDFSYAVPGCARFRGNVMFQRGTLAAVFRAVPFVIPDFDKLGLPQDIKRLCDLPRGLILVTGPTGSGKSTTLAAMIDLINNTRACNIVTVEDPIEFLHKHKKSSVRQREIGTDTHSFASALRHVLRHDPDIIMIGEMRDQESISIALTAAETGHLVLSTLHTQTAPLTITRIIDSFSEDKRVQIRQQLANSLRAVISQQLIPTIDGKGLVVAVEYMVDTPAVRSMIREGKEHQLYSAIQTGQKDGMQTMDQALIKLFKAGRISRESVLEYCVDRAEVERLIKNAFYDQF
ncbi:MAG TPA: type IV pilus twitching motility protein PilT [Thermoclostridium caenicola]|nr:type IV pilus twitching motility protein PilT [Thermoclostridium caenicola]